ncbi:MAG TPA: MurR/RpiR family transcriptional regulator [Ilumatobacter sp.]
MEIAERIRVHGAALTSAERRVAEAILAAPQAVAFGTVADLARAADVGAASVVRLATRLGFDGYSDLQQSVQQDLTRQLRPAAERIHETGSGSRSDHTEAELANVRATLAGVDDEALRALVERLSDPARPVAVISGEASAGVAAQFAAQLHQLRGGVTTILGSEVAVRRELALLDPAATVLVIDLRRYERWVLDALAVLHRRGTWFAGLTDSVLSPVAARAAVAFVVAADSIGPFDSHVGTLALLDLIALDVATALRQSATERLAVVEAAWSEHGALTDGGI